MAEHKTFQGRIVQKHDTKTNWDKATNFIPLKGEIIVYDDLNKIKIGDGTTKVGNLAFVNDLDTLATVAKTGSYNDLINKPTIPTVPTAEIIANTEARHTHDNKDILDNITGIVDLDHIDSPENNTDLVQYDVFYTAANQILEQIPTVPTKVSAFTNDANYATQTDLTNATAGITGAMHFIGTSTTAITDHGTENPTIDGTAITTKTAGDTVIYDHLEFVWDGAKWEKLGDEGSYVLKTQKINGKALSGDVDLTADDVDALPITGGTLKGDLEIPQSYKLTLNNAFIKGSTSGNTIYLNITNAMGRNTIITGIETPDQKTAAANKEYVDTEINTVKGNIPTKISDLENDKTLKVTFSYSNSTYSANKNRDEIATAITSGYYVYGVLGNAIFNVSYFNNNNGMIIFSKIANDGVVSSLRFQSDQVIYMTTSLQSVDNKISEITSTSTDSTYPSAKAVYDYVQSAIPTTTIITWTDDGT